MQSMRAKVRVYNVTANKDDKDQVFSEDLTFVFPAKDGPYPPDGSDEDQQFAKYSPSGDLRLTVANPNLLGKFSIGDTFYLDFVPIEPAT